MNKPAKRCQRNDTRCISSYDYRDVLSKETLSRLLLWEMKQKTKSKGTKHE